MKYAVSPLDFYLAVRSVNENSKISRKKTLTIHQKKLANLGINNDLAPCDPKKVIFNFSSASVPTKIETLLAFGLDFCLPVYKIDFYKFFLPIEGIAARLKIKFSSSPKFKDFIRELRTASNKFYYGFKSYKIFSPIFSSNDVNLLKNFAKNKNIIVTTPDKGRGVVIIDKKDYISSMTQIISDITKFQLIHESWSKYTLKIEDKINRFLLKLKNKGVISDDIYYKLHATGSSPGILYGLPKIHKNDFNEKFQFRPIFASYNVPSYKIAKYLVSILSSLTSNEYSVSNSYIFSHDITKIQNSNSLFMASFDIENLFTNVPLNETIDIILKLLYPQNVLSVIGLTE